jgi:hypothetical protein
LKPSVKDALALSLSLREKEQALFGYFSASEKIRTRKKLKAPPKRAEPTAIKIIWSIVSVSVFAPTAIRIPAIARITNVTDVRVIRVFVSIFFLLLYILHTFVYVK